MNKKVKMIIGIILLLIIASAICSCKTTKYVTVPEYHLRDTTKMVYQRDSIYSRDSIYVFAKGDTVYHEHFNTKYREFYHSDTLSVVRADSIRVPYPVSVTKTIVVHSMYWYQKMFMWTGIACFCICLIWLVIKLYDCGALNWIKLQIFKWLR